MSSTLSRVEGAARALAIGLGKLPAALDVARVRQHVAEIDQVEAAVGARAHEVPR